MATIVFSKNDSMDLPDELVNLQAYIGNLADKIELAASDLEEIDSDIYDFSESVTLASQICEDERNKKDSFSDIAGALTEYLEMAWKIDCDVAEMVEEKKDDFYVSDGERMVPECELPWFLQEWFAVVAIIVLAVLALLLAIVELIFLPGMFVEYCLTVLFSVISTLAAMCAPDIVSQALVYGFDDYMGAILGVIIGGHFGVLGPFVAAAVKTIYVENRKNMEGEQDKRIPEIVADAIFDSMTAIAVGGFTEAFAEVYTPASGDKDIYEKSGSLVADILQNYFLDSDFSVYGQGAEDEAYEKWLDYIEEKERNGQPWKDEVRRVVEETGKKRAEIKTQEQEEYEKEQEERRKRFWEAVKIALSQPLITAF